MLGFGKGKEERSGVEPAQAPAPDTTSSIRPPTSAQTDTSTGQGASQVHKSLGMLLLEAGLVTQANLDEALAEQEKRGGFLGQILVQLGHVKPESVASCLVKQCKIPHLSLLDYDIGADVLSLVPEEICKKYHLVPIDKLGRILTLAMVDPLDLEALEAVRRICPELRIKPILCNWEHFQVVSAKVFPNRNEAPPGGEVTAQSLGLMPETKAPPKAAPPPAPPQAPVSSETPPSAPPAPPPQGTPPAPPPGISTEALAGVLRQSMQETFGAFTAQLEEMRGTSPAAPAPAGPTGEELAILIRDSVGSVMQEAMASLVVHLRATPPATPPAALPEEELARLSSAIRDSVGAAMQEGLSALAASLPQAGASTPEGNASPGINTRELSQSLREAFEEAQAVQSARLAEIAEAALQSVQQASQLVESAVVLKDTQSDLQGGRKSRHASVSPFRGGTETEATNNAHEEEDARVREALESEHPLETLTFDRFFPGNANVFTFRLAQAVSEMPGREYNPFFLFGHVGIGKTHLISAMGNAILARDPGARVGYVSASHFARRLGEAAQEKALEAFRDNYCHWDVLILDDIQFMGGRVEAQEEFFHIFNVLHQQGRQIIIASDKAPDRLGLLEKRLVSRFASGIVAELKAPEWETRMAILRHHAQDSNGPAVPEEILSLIAMRVPDDIRKMTGSLRKVIAYANLVGQEMSCEMANEILSHLGIEAAA
jgi:chromosomal replication initiator protein DnaA